MGNIRVGIWPAGSQVGIEVFRALSMEKGIHLVGLNNEPSYADMIYAEIYNDAGIDTMNDYNLDYIFPCNEATILLCAKAKGMLTPKVVSHPQGTVYVCNSKITTADTFYPLTAGSHFIVEESCTGMVAKPNYGHSGVGFKELEWGVDYGEMRVSEKLAAFEKLWGDEYTVECFTQKGKVIYCLARSRSKTMAGISVISEDAPIEVQVDAYLLAIDINKKLEFTGAWFYQAKHDKNCRPRMRAFEIGARIAGSSGLSRAKGINLPVLHLYNAMGVDIEIPEPLPVEKIYRSFDVKAKLPDGITKVAFDWDDTVLLNGVVQPLLMAFAWKMKQEGKEVVMITKNELLLRHTIPHPFAEIITIPRDKKKGEFAEENTLLVDDSFSERKGWKYAISPSQVEMFL